jgi:hypothetical protein
VFLKRNHVTDEVQRMPAHFYLLSEPRCTLKSVVQSLHPLQQPPPFKFVIAIISSIADALALAASKGVVHLNMDADSVMVEEPDSEFMAHEAKQLGVESSKCLRRFEQPPVAVVVNWATAMYLDAACEWVLQVPIVHGKLVLAAPPWGSDEHVCPELHMSLKRAKSDLAAMSDAVITARNAMVAALAGTVYPLRSHAERLAAFQVQVVHYSPAVCALVVTCRRVACGCDAGGDDADVAAKEARFVAAVTARDAAGDVVRLDYSKQPTFEIGTLGFWISTGKHPCGDGYPAGLPEPYDVASYPAMPPSWPPSFRELLALCVSLDPRDRPEIAEVASRLEELRTVAWMSVDEAVARTQLLVCDPSSCYPKMNFILITVRRRVRCRRNVRRHCDLLSNRPWTCVPSW